MTAGTNEPKRQRSWALWEVFTQAKDGAPHEHRRSVQPRTLSSRWQTRATSMRAGVRSQRLGRAE